MITIILPIHNGLEGTKKTIQSIFDTVKDVDYEILIIESESIDGTKEYIEQLKENYPELIRIMWGKKEGLPKAMNIGITNSTGDVLITQNDIIFNKYDFDWLEMMEKATKEENIGLACPINAFSSSSGYDNSPWVGTWCMYIPRKTINKIGLFDEEFSPGCGDDIDYSYRVMKAGMNLVVLPFMVNHNRDAVEHFNDWEELKQKHLEYFYKKYNLKFKKK